LRYRARHGCHQGQLAKLCFPHAELIDHRQDSYVEVVGPAGPFEIWIGGLDGRARCIPAKAQDSVTRSGRAQTPRHDAPDDRERLAARGTAHQQRMPLFAAQQPIGLALFCQ
jgi:hypothetical protein